ncbi:hypothetical protein KA183_21210 [bacterium]|nr:hypothetical protein [bacterium]
MVFNADGLLEPRDFVMTLDEIRQSILVRGPSGQETWDSEWRLKLADNLEILAKQLWKVGIEKIFVDGSYVEEKAHPNDIDGYFECDLLYFATGKLQQDLNALDLNKVWTWDKDSRTVDPNSAKGQLPMWHRYRVELYPHYDQPSGIPDEFGNNLLFPAAFRKSRKEHKAKGIILLKQN